MKTPDLDLIASVLEGLEETIIYKLLDRAQFRVNRRAYTPGESDFTGEERFSLFDVRLRYQEELDAKFGRFMVPEERPFNTGLPHSARRVHAPENCLRIDEYDSVNLTGEITQAYLDVLPLLCEDGDDFQYGSSTEHDVIAVQAISRRIHFGAMYVAESKYRSNSTAYDRAVVAGDTAELERMLTRPEVEERIYERIVSKVEYLQARINRTVRRVVDPLIVRDMYRNSIIPLTKRGEILYLLSRRSDRPRG